MLLFPAIDLYQGQAVRLYQGDYAQMTVYSKFPEEVALRFREAGAQWVHLVDLEGARDGTTPNLNTVRRIREESGLKAEIGGGIRNMDTAKRYFDWGVDRIILGTAAVHDRAFLENALDAFGEKVAVGMDIRDGFVATHGWRSVSNLEAIPFCRELETLGVANIIVTDISRDGAMRGTNRALYRRLSQETKMDITASGGVSTLEDIRALREAGLYGAILGKAWYTGAIDLKEALEAAR